MGTNPPTRTTSPIRRFDPRKVARLEKDNWVAYYRKDWLTLLRVAVGMVKEAFGLTWPEAVYGAYLVARAEMAAAPADNNIPRAEKSMRRFYTFIKRVHEEDFDPGQAAHLEVRWWIIHRRLFGQAENQELVEALVDLYVATYGVLPEQVWDAAKHRAQAMLYSDRWIEAGKPKHSSLLDSEEQELVVSYTSLRSAVQADPANAILDSPVSFVL